jgi:hypothetical protein
MKGDKTMENFYDYVIENYTLSEEAKRILDNIVIWAGDHYIDGDNLTYEGIHFIDFMLSDSIGMEINEISENWH